MGKYIAGFVFGGTVGVVLTIMSGQPIWHWQWWAGFFPIMITATVWKETR